MMPSNIVSFRMLYAFIRRFFAKLHQGCGAMTDGNHQHSRTYDALFG